MAGIRLVPTVNSDGSIDINVVGGTLDAGDIEIGAVEIKNSGDDTRATVGANGLHSDVRAVPADPFGTNADAASATGSISAKLRRLATDLAAVISGNKVQVDVISTPVLASTTDAIAAKLATDKIMNGLAELTPKFIFANVAASQTDANIVTAVTSKKIRVLAVLAVQGATASAGITFNSKGGGAGTAISALFAAGANSGFAASFNPVGWFETASGEALTVTTGAGATVGIQVVYVEV